jgi:hypothetical protein
LGVEGELNDACFVVPDANGQKLAYVYFENEPGRRREGLQRISPGVASEIKPYDASTSDR